MTTDRAVSALGPKSRLSLSDFLGRLLGEFAATLDEELRQGLVVRLFNKTIPTGTWPIDCLMGRTCNFGRQPENLNTEFGNIEMKRPVASRLIRSSAGSPITVVRG
jgi:hypothetical protein